MTKAGTALDDYEAGEMLWVNMGQWPCYVGFTTSPFAFENALRHMNITEPVNFLGGPQANATTHSFVSPKGSVSYIITFQVDKRRRSKEQVAALLAHEVMHIIQYMQDDYAAGERLGVEAEGYLMQHLLQEILQYHYKSKLKRATTPTGISDSETQLD